MITIHLPGTGTQTMRERGIDGGGERIADWLEHSRYQSEVKTPDEDEQSNLLVAKSAEAKSEHRMYMKQVCFSFSALSLPGLGTVQWSGNQVSPAVPVEHQGLAAGQHPAAEADLRPAKRGEAVVGGEARAGETLRQESREGLGGKLAGRTTEAWVTSGRGERREEERRGRRGKT